MKNSIGKIGLIYDPVHDELYHALKGAGAFCNEVPIPVLQKGTVENRYCSFKCDMAYRQSIA